LESKSVSDPNLTTEACSIALLTCKEGAGPPTAAGGQRPADKGAATPRCTLPLWSADRRARGRRAGVWRRSGGPEGRARSGERRSRVSQRCEQGELRGLALCWAACLNSESLLPYSLPGLLGKKLKTCCLVTWATTRAMAWAAVVLGASSSYKLVNTCFQ
jgi:hypothetical protein